jgi:ribose 5-phosphate isomerase A
MVNKTQIKKMISHTAVDILVKSGMKLGLGTGSTAIGAVRRIAYLIKEKKLKDLSIVTTSMQTKMECLALGIPITSILDPHLGAKLDLTIDGADEINPDYKLIKGHGGALLREKIVAYASGQFAIVAYQNKLVDLLGIKCAVPVEVTPEALYLVSERLKVMGADVTLRMATHFVGPIYTEQGNIILDAKFQSIPDPDTLEKEIKLIPGAMECGLFCRKVDHLFIGYENGKVEHRQGKD